MQVTIDVDEHKGVGPTVDMYGHGPVTAIVPADEDGAELFICLDCGYTAHDNRLLAHEECDREDNGINQTWREYLAERDAASVLPDTGPDGEWPIEE